MAALDLQLLLWAQEYSPEWLLKFFVLVSQVSSVLSIGAIAMLLFRWLKRKDAISRQQFLKVLAVFGFSALVVFASKYAIDRERPFRTHTEVVKLSSGGSPSFPSGHTTEVFAIATAFLLLFGKKWGVAAARMGHRGCVFARGLGRALSHRCDRRNVVGRGFVPVRTETIRSL